jgi:Ca2+-binding EF-hand superfamily protein
MDRNDFPFDKIFSEFDSQQVGGLSFTDFAAMNEFVGVCLAKKNLKKVFNIVDRDGSGKILIDEVRNISNLTMRPDETDASLLPPADELMETAPEDLKGKAILIRQQVNEIYEEVKNKLEHKNVTLEHVFFSH